MHSLFLAIALAAIGLAPQGLAVQVPVERLVFREDGASAQHHGALFLYQQQQGGALATNATLGSRLYHEIHMELHREEVPEKSKLVLAIIYALGLGFCGVDRCFMGQVVLGVIKGVTCGGVFVWFIIDSIIIMINCLAKWDSINALGYRAKFPKDELNTAFWIAVVAIAIHIICKILGAVGATQAKVTEEPAAEAKADAEAS